MMKQELKTPERVFLVGRSEIKDPAPTLSPSKAWALIADNYPHVKNAIVNEPVFEGGRLAVCIETPPAKTNG